MKLVSWQKAEGRKQKPAAGSLQFVGAGLSPALSDVQKKPNIKSTARLVNKCMLLFLSLISLATIANAQPDSGSTIKTSPIEMATGLRSSGKIYVVVTALLIILAGLIFYLIRLDRKITRLEKEGNN